MVRITDALEKKGEKSPFVVLELQGDIEFVQSQRTGKHYATVRKCTITSTFDLPTAKSFIGKEMAGNIVRIEAAPYKYTLKDTGEIITLHHT